MDSSARLRVNEWLSAPGMDAMNFLNEAIAINPDAISFAAGRPADEHLAVRGAERWIERFVAERSRRTGRAPAAVWSELGQYADTNGMIGELVADYLRTDEGIAVPAASIMMTCGLQEALIVLLLGLLDRGRDVLLSEDPTYVGLTGAAAVAGVPVEPIAAGDGAFDEAVAAAIAAAQRRGREPRALYVIPDFSNPTGRSLTLAERRGVLALARRHGMLLFEDTVYRPFAYGGERLPTLKSLDDGGHVVYLGSFSKLVMPGLRLGFLVGDQRLASGALLAEELSKVKGYLSVTTSPIAQAILGGLLLEQGGSLAEWNRAKVADCARRRARLLECLDVHVGGDPALGARVAWNRPGGGYFIVMTLPFEFGHAELIEAAREHGVIVCPMRFLSPSGGHRDRIRLSFANVPLDAIEPGVLRLRDYLARALDRARPEAHPGGRAGRDRAV